MIKFTAIIIIVWVVLSLIVRIYMMGLSGLDVIRIKSENYNLFEKILFGSTGITTILSMVCGAISAIMLVIRYL